MMQGRVRPERLDAYQIFPSSAWREELREIGSIGFDFVELLYDRRLDCVGAMEDRAPREAESVCADFLTSVSAVASSVAFVEALSKAVGWARSRGAGALVVPFFQENVLSSAADLRQVLDLLSEAGVDPEFRQTGVLKLAFTEEQVDELRRNLVWQSELGMDVVWLDPTKVAQREPEVNPAVLGKSRVGL